MATDSFDVWKDLTIRTYFKWGRGRKNLKGKNTLSTFKVVVKQGLGGSGATAKPFMLEFDPLELPEYWRHVVLQPMGSADPPPHDKLLPPIEDLTNDDVLANLEQVHREMDTAATQVRRLEAYIPVPTDDPDNPKFDEVRMVYLKEALADKKDPQKRHDYVVISFRTVMGGGPQPNGGGSGPPDL